MIAPATTLVWFLAGSVLHLGLGDTEDGLLPDRVPPWLGIVGVSLTSACAAHTLQDLRFGDQGSSP
jgi:hypothetical protein